MSSASALCLEAPARAAAAIAPRCVASCTEPAKRVGAYRFNEQGFRFDDRPARPIAKETCSGRIPKTISLRSSHGTRNA